MKKSIHTDSNPNGSVYTSIYYIGYMLFLYINF